MYTMTFSANVVLADAIQHEMGLVYRQVHVVYWSNIHSTVSRGPGMKGPWPQELQPHTHRQWLQSMQLYTFYIRLPNFPDILLNGKPRNLMINNMKLNGNIIILTPNWAKINIALYPLPKCSSPHGWTSEPQDHFSLIQSHWEIHTVNQRKSGKYWSVINGHSIWRLISCQETDHFTEEQKNIYCDFLSSNTFQPLANHRKWAM